ncbi:hypothetical protein KEH51_09065 [[Brevibacterium] frigoritolerans]|uniref:Uncharacterized protein n=1 Tax=Peribacillus frigoritolerans TaxID=450367 RepID=A0A941J541_9BACI|nr:hypothetical protein [Peribacillus frigoritolerans]
MPKEKKDRKMIQPPPSQGKPRNSRNLKAIKVLMKKENQREPLRKKGKGAKGKKDRKMIQHPPSQGKPRNSQNLKAIKVLMKKENQRNRRGEKGQRCQRKKGSKDDTASTESGQTQELSEPKGHKGSHEEGESAGTAEGKRAKVPKEKKDRKMIQPPPSQGKPRSSRNLKAIKVLMKKENQREPVRGNMARALKGKRAEKKIASKREPWDINIFV